jgi:hypothetical protein
MGEVQYRVEGRLIWWRGPAKLQGEYVVLDRERAERYAVDTQAGPGDDLAFDLAGIRSTDEALAFVRRWGPITTGPDSGRSSEKVADLVAEGQSMSAVLTMYADLLRYYEQGDEAEPSAQWGPILEALGEGLEAEPTTLAEITAAIINDALGHTPLAVGVNPAFGAKGEAPFHASIGAADLRGFAYFHAATLLMDSTPVGKCEECGRPFEVKHPRQRYDTERCGSRARQRRFSERKAGR